MDFISYTAYEIVAIIKGLLGMKLITQALLLGNLITPILYFFLFLSLYRIGIDWFSRRDYTAVFKHIFFFSLFVFFVSYTATFNVYNLNLVKYFVDKNISSFWEGIDVRNDMLNSRVKVDNVPIMSSFLSFPDMLAYELTQTIISADDKNVNKDMIGMKIRTNPSFLLDLAYMDFIQADTTNEALSRIYESAYCFGVPEYMKRNYPEEKETYDLIFSKTGILAKLSKSTLLSWIPGANKCQRYTNEYVDSIRKMASRYITGADDGSRLLRKYFYELADKIKSSRMFPRSLKESITRNLIATKNITENTVNLIKSGHLDNNWHGFKEAIQNLYSSVKYAVSTTVADKYYNELFMYKIQQILEFLFIALFPLIFSMAFLPVFGYNFKLLFSAMFTFFLIKMWLPIYYIAHQLLYNHLLSEMNVYLSKAISIFIATAYAGPVDTAILIDTIVPETEHFNDVILNTLAMVIPTALGGGSMFFFGREFINASMKSASESMGLAKSLFFAGRGSFRSAGGTGSGGIVRERVMAKSSGQSNTISSGNTASLSTTISGGGRKTIQFQQNEKGIYVPTHTSISTNSIRSGGYERKGEYIGRSYSNTGISNRGIIDPKTGKPF